VQLAGRAPLPGTVAGCYIHYRYAQLAGVNGHLFDFETARYRREGLDETARECPITVKEVDEQGIEQGPIDIVEYSATESVAGPVCILVNL